MTIEGLEIITKVTALAQGEGFIVRVDTSWDMPTPNRALIRKAQKQGIVGRLVNTHEASYADAQTTVVDAVTAWEEDVKAFIQSVNE